MTYKEKRFWYLSLAVVWGLLIREPFFDYEKLKFLTTEAKELRQAEDLYERGHYSEAFVLYYKNTSYAGFQPYHMQHLGYLYEIGAGTKADTATATYWYMVAAPKGDEMARNRLRIMAAAKNK
jgi:TPR repeat protein